MISIVCVYNDKNILENFLLKSLKNQTAKFELILLDNRQEQFKSAAEALNYGGRKAKSDYIMFVHQDVDLSSNTWLEEVEKILDKLPNLGIAGVAGKCKNKEGVRTNIKHDIPPRFAGKILGGVIPIAIFGSAAVTILLVKGKTCINTSYWKYALGLSLPLMIHNFSSILNSSFDRIIISRYLGSSPTGIYSFAYSVGMIPLIFLSSTNSAWNPWFFEKMRDGKHEDIRKYSKIYRDVFTIAYAGLLLISPELVKLLAEQSYWEGMYLLPWTFMAVYFQFMYKYEVRVEIYYKKTSLISAGTLFSAGINVGLNILLVPIYGYPAAAVTTAISYFFLFIFHYILTSRIIKFNLHGLWFHIQSLIYVGLTTSFYFITRSSILMRISGIIILLVLLYFAVNRTSKSA